LQIGGGPTQDRQVKCTFTLNQALQCLTNQLASIGQTTQFLCYEK
jgi:hypothetical protein